MAVIQDVHNVEWKLGRSDNNSDFSSHTLPKAPSNFKVQFSSPEDFVRKSGGVRIIEKILIANNGIAAVKCMRSLRKWSYATFGSSDVLRFVCMATPEDIQANAEYIKMANKMVLVPGGSNVNNYANVELILQTAVTNEVDAVWAGWGHASENPQLPDVLSKHNIAFLGPSHQAMWTLGDKVASTILAQSAHVPTLPWSGSDLIISLDQVAIEQCSNNNNNNELEVTDNSTSSIAKSTGLPPQRTSLYSRLISEKLYRSCCVTDVASCLKCAEKIGYPVMIKASGGGGGKGIRKALNNADIERVFPQVQAEVPGSPIFVMKCATSVRHLEVQILCDIYGQAISLFGRDCSVQRRHQKIIEEAPVIVAPKEIIEKMEQAAVSLSKLVGYVSAGTVEYLYDPNSNQFYFLELNPRLQVEHPCTEVVAEVNLPACQLQIAMGIPLHRIKDIRELYLASPWSDSKIDFNDININRRPPSCYVIAARITSEDPDEGFKPRPGGVRELNFRSNQSVWGYFSVSSAGGIHEFADSQFGHIFSAGENREHARENMVLALKELSIRGDFRTTVEYLIKVMESEAFINHKIDTEWLDTRIAQKDQVEKPDVLLGVICTALHIADNCLKQLFLNYELHLERGQFLPSKTLTNSVDVTLVSDSTKFIVKVLRTGPSDFSLICCDTVLDLEVHRMPGDGLLICHDAASYMTYCHEESQGYRTVINNRTMMLCKETDPTVLRSPSAGKLLQYCVTEGSHVCANEVYALIEVMKMILELRVPTSGIITLKRIPGVVLESGTELARIELDESSQLKPLQIFNGPFTLPTEYTSDINQSSCSRKLLFLPQVTMSYSSTNNISYQSSTHSIEDVNSNIHRHHPIDWKCLDTKSYCTNDSILNVNNDSMFNLLSNCNLATNNGKLHLQFSKLFASFEQILFGYCLPEPYFSKSLIKNLNQFLSLLSNPRLPLHELQDTLARLKGQLPPTMEKSLRLHAKIYADQATSVLANFPSEPILQITDKHLKQINPEAEINCQSTDPSVLAFQRITQRLVDLAERYQNGLRGHTVRVISQLFMGYVVIEKHFQYGQYDKCIRHLLARCQGSNLWGNAPKSGVCPSENTIIHNDSLNNLTFHLVPFNFHNLIQPNSMSDIVSVIFSHQQLAMKNVLIINLIHSLAERRELCMTDNLQSCLKALTELGGSRNSKVALAARQLLISVQTPSYELRRNQVESIFLSAVDTFGQQVHPELLLQLINSETVVFDILTDFFYHSNQAVASAALEVYIRRSYTAYELTGVHHFQLSCGSSFFTFRFMLPKGFVCSSSTVNRRSSDSDKVNSQKFSLEHSLHSPIIENVQTNYNTTSFNGIHSKAQDSTTNNKASVMINSFQSMINIDSTPLSGERMGGMTAFNSLNDLEESFDELIRLFNSACKEAQSMHTSLSEPIFDYSHQFTSDVFRQKSHNHENFTNEAKLISFQDPPYHTYFNQFNQSDLHGEPIHILNIALRQSTDRFVQSNRITSDEYTSILCKSKSTGFTSPLLLPDSVINETSDVTQLEEFCSRHVDQLRASGIRRITFLVVKTREFPRLYTFRARDNYREDRVYRHLEPALAFQLELNRMKNYNLEHLPTLNRRMHLYLGCSKINGRKDVDYRFFVRCIIRHADLVSREASFEYLQSEAEQILLEAMDALDLASGHPDASRTMGNHIFLNFVPVLLLEDISRLKSTIRTTVMRYARRFLRLRVSQAELKLHIRFHASDPVVPIRVMLRDEHGYDLGLDVYREVLDPITGISILQSISSPNGRLNGHPAVTAHENKDFFEVKRFQARKFNTTYVYDYPALFAQALTGVWQSYCPSVNTVNHELSASNSSETDSFNRQTLHSKNNSLSKFHGLIPLNIPENLVLACTELSLDKDGNLQPNTNTLGTNEIGVVVWYMVLRTPETPSGRPIIVIANDATFKAGSFGPAEDLTFYRASQLARQLKIPRFYLASNTGARIKIAEDLKGVFNIAWIDSEHPEKGYKYLYLTPDDYYHFKIDDAVNCERVEENGEIRFKIIDIIGKEYDMSVENLRGSAMIAGETSAAYDDIFTITIVTNRAIGIGAYLTRLGQRVIQVNNSHIILTGAMALNKLLGCEVYSSNSQLGGVQVMATNGVSHLVASDELCALQLSIEWLSYIPQYPHFSILYKPIQIERGHNFNIRNNLPKIEISSHLQVHQPKLNKQTEFYLPFDPIDRIVEYVPSRERPNDDPRWMFTGIMSSHFEAFCKSSSKQTSSSSSDQPFDNSHTDHWISGFFDWGTWQETLSSWAAGVVTGRARLGGIPCGVITAETRSVVCRVPADPANLSSEAQIVNQAGQVWYPDSAYKTAQAIADLSRENLPLFIFANWRGFSGDIFNEFTKNYRVNSDYLNPTFKVLKFGSMIIDSLRRYTKPVFVYLPPNSQLRGGAWVVVDPAINPDFMEMYADPVSSRAGVLEPEGTVEIKYRQQDLINTINRLDDSCKLLSKELNRLTEHANNLTENDYQEYGTNTFDISTDEHCQQLRTALEARQKELLPFYQQVACTFADLHDTPGRLLSRKLVHRLVDWSSSRSFFYARLRHFLRVESNHRIRFDSESLTQTIPTNDMTNGSDGRYSLSNMKSTFCKTKEAANNIAKNVPNLAISYTYHTGEKMSLLKTWFIEALNTVNSQYKSTTTIDQDISLNNIHDSVSTFELFKCNPYEIWENNDIIIGNWLANEFDCNELLPLATIECVKEFCSLDTLNCLSFIPVKNFITNLPDSQLFKQNIIKTKINQLKKQRLIEHIKQCLINGTQLSSNELTRLFRTVLNSSERHYLANLLLSDSTEVDDATIDDDDDDDKDDDRKVEKDNDVVYDN
ncbi:Acetyl-CoA carboxylase [Schistosoma japonicum]|nr:Acetyl-CoA carboxylase [Schistosoma japonicum]